MSRTIRTLIVVAALLAPILIAGSSSAQPATADPYVWEPAPVCGSPLDLELGSACTPIDESSNVDVGTLVCPSLSRGRFNGGAYNWADNPFGLDDGVTYNNPTGNVAALQAEDDRREWRLYCRTPRPGELVVEVTPAPTATPAPPVVVVVQPTPTPVAVPVNPLRPVFTG